MNTKQCLHASASIACMAAALTLDCSTLHAQAVPLSAGVTPPSAPQSAKSAPNKSGAIEEVVVTAQHRSERLQNVPISINAFTRRDIQQLGLTTTSDLSAVTPNLTIALSQGQGNQPLIAIRGIGINDENTNNAGPVAVYMDDVYLSSPSSQTFGLFDLDRIEVLKGPQGTIYGRNSSGGAIDYVSAKPTDTLSEHFRVDYSSYNTVHTEAALGGAITSNLDGRIAVMDDYSDGYVRNILDGKTENGENDYAARGQLLYKVNDDLKFLLNVHAGQLDVTPNDYGHFGDLEPGTEFTGNPVVCSNGQVRADQCVDIFGYTQPKKYFSGAFSEEAHELINSAGASLRGDYALGYLTLTSITGFETNRKSLPENTDSAPYDELKIHWGVKDNEFTQEFRLAHSDERLNWTLGAYYLFEQLRQNQPLDFLLSFDQFFGPGSGDGIASKETDQSRQTTQAGAVFGQADYKITDRLKAILGGRFTQEHRTFLYTGSVAYQQGGEGNFGPATSLLPPQAAIPALDAANFSFRAGLEYQFAPRVMGYATVASGFKSGDFNGGFLSTIPAQALVQLSPVKPERDIAYELGMKSTLLGNRLLFNAAAFYTDYTDLQLFSLIQSPEGPLNSLTNAQKVHNEGIDLEMSAKPIPALTLTANVGLLDTRIDKFFNALPGVAQNLQGLQLAFAPHASALLMVDYRLPISDNVLDLNFNASYKDHQFYDSTNDPYLAQSAYWLENVRLTYEFDHGRWQVAGYIKNLLNYKYSVDSFNSTSPFGYIQPVYGLPRFFGFQLDYRL